MSLIHWWPLNGNTNDIGVKNCNLAGTPVFSNDGKIGKCVSSGCGILTMPASETQQSLSNDHTSITFWFNNGGQMTGDCAICGTNGNGNWGSGSVGRTWDFFNYPTKNDFHWSMGNISGGVLSGVFQDNVWHHVAVVADGGILTIYIDGVVQWSGNRSGDCATFESEYGIYAPGASYKLNDFRIYDHALSQKEVKEISKGLVLHYNFEDPYAEGTTNLIDQSNPITAVVRCSTYGNGVKIDWTQSENQGDTYFIFNAPDMTEGVTYAFSFDCEGLLPDSDVTWAVSNTYAPAKIHNGRNVFIFTANSTENRLFFDDWSRDIRLSNLTMTNFQLEQKDHATPYVNGTRPNGLIYDSSGYGYNGTQVDCSIVEPSDNTSGKCSLLTNTSGYVQMPNIYLDTTFTISTWCKHLDSFSTWARIFDFGNATSGQDYDIGFATSDTSGSMYVFGRCGSGTTLPDSYVGVMDYDWHLWTLTVDGVFIKLYRDGELIKEFSSYYNVGGVLYTLNYLNKSNWDWDGVSNKYYADFKIFNTALSAEDILLEYNRKASIDKTGKLFAQYLVENGQDEELLPGTQYGSNALYIRSDGGGTVINNSEGDLQMTGSNWVASEMIPVVQGDTYYYEIIYSNTSSNLFYVGLEQYDEDYASGSNELCWYCYAATDSAKDHERVFGSFTMSGVSENGKPLVYMRLRVLNNWNWLSGDMTVKIHHISLRHVTSIQPQKVEKNGIVSTNDFREDTYHGKTSFYKNGFISSTDIEEC